MRIPTPNMLREVIKAFFSQHPYTLQEAVDLFLLRYKPGATQDSYARSLGYLMDFLESGIELEEIEFTDLDRWIASMYNQNVRFESHPHRPNEAGRLSDATIRSRVKQVRVFFNFAVKAKWLAVAPTDLVRTPRYKPNPEDIKTIAPEDAQAMIDTAWMTRDRAALMFLTTGACEGGVCSLRISKLTFTDEGGEAVITEKGDTRSVSFGADVRDALLAWLDERLETPDHDYMFTSEKQREAARKADDRDGALSNVPARC